MLKLPVEKTKMSISDMTTFEGRLKGTEEFTFGNKHMSTRTTESENASLARIAVSTHERAGCVPRCVHQDCFGDPHVLSVLARSLPDGRDNSPQVPWYKRGKKVHREDKSVDLIQDAVRLGDTLSC